MNNLEVTITGTDEQPTLVTLVRQDAGGLYGEPQSCHLFAFSGTKGVEPALKEAIHEYLREKPNTYKHSYRGETEVDWFEMMAEREDYHDIFAKHGFTEVRIPRGMVSIVFSDRDPLKDYLET